MSQTARFSQAALFIASWMALGWCFKLNPYAYLVVGIPLCILFQLFVRRRPLSSCWVRDTTKVRLDAFGIAMALAFSIVPAGFLVEEWPGANWGVRLYFLASLVGAVGVAFALRRFTASAARSLLLCLATAGVLGCGMMLLVAFAQHHKLPLTLARARFALVQFLALLPVCFVMEEVAFRGVLDSHIQHPQDSRRWASALLLSAMWGWWHLPITPASALGAGMIVFPITHAMLGVPFSLFWRRSGNLLVPAAVHALIDAVRNTVI
jgi:membrane protease YdiL (CAAX protease family)